MAPAQGEQLNAVLDGAFEAVGAVELGGVAAADVPVGGQGVQGGEGAAQAQALVDAPVDELEELDAELDVAQAAGAELDLGPGVLGRRIAWASLMKSSRPPTCQTRGSTIRQKPSVSSGSPAIGRALSMAWNSQFLAHRS